MRTYDNTKFPFVNKERIPEKNIKDTTVQYQYSIRKNS